ncbi:hypothetical protein JIN77_06425 [Verrucomicrobiaceae bacterium R5-34]|uniref:Uncharacterized protein n=1 Tax=Oceaniferula flava TaxID=2800421 RepID=A0AAE2VDC5_9BACT|nr:hypothetical protein [Oceaniferula flavus]MBK1830352.1 hypothetical protein [Verrucomicrobiaceae bacterium R5-34]MBK1854444.1 hypothetical protein [Oceaniferula flavus]MBM1135750.1 hypothetical protein [Oceaniferula flavus]
MPEEKHPSELNPLQLYGRAVKLATSTTRLKNGDWYNDALDLDVQVHCYMKDEGGVDNFLHVKSRNYYEKIESLNSHQLEQYEELEKFVQTTLSHEAAKGAKSLGIVFYLADELSIASLGPEHQNPGELQDLNSKMVESPKEVLEDKTVSTEFHAWRLFPYPGAAAGNEFATAVAVSRKREDTLSALRDIGESLNLPIRTAALSAPLCAIHALPWFSNADPKGTVSVFNYQKFTLLAFFNEHFDLMLFRYMPHPNGATVPANIGPAVLATATAFELENPKIQILPLSGADVDPAIISLQSSMMGSEIVLIDLTQVVRSRQLPDYLPVEILATTQELDEELSPLAANETFRSCIEEGWHTQDFLMPRPEELELSPSEADMKLLKLGRRLRTVAAMILGGVVLYTGFNIWTKIRSDAWMYKTKNTAATTAALGQQLKQYNHWENLLKDRSKGWVSMELISRIAPADGSVALSGVIHQVNLKPEPGAAQYGFQKSWTIDGYMNAKGMEHLSNIGTREGVKQLFTEVAEFTGNEAYLPDAGKRDVTVTFKRLNNPKFHPANPTKPEQRYPHAFKMTITQSFGSDDNMSVADVVTSDQK